MKAFLLRSFILKPTERPQVPLKNLIGIFKIALRLLDQPIFMVQSLEILNDFNVSTLKQV